MPARTAARRPVSGLYGATLAAAEKSLRLQEIPDARRWLDHAPTELRGWEWHYLNAQMDDSLHCVSTSQATITSMAASPDGKLVATSDSQGTVELRDPQTRAVLRKIGDHSEAVYAVRFSPDSRRLVTVSRDVTARVWDVESGGEVSRVELENPGVASTAFAPDGKVVATCSWRLEEHGDQVEVHGVVWLWDPDTGTVVHQRDVGVKPLDSLAWSRDGSYLVVGSWDGLVHVLDGTGQELRTLEMPSSDVYNAVISVAVSPNERWVAAGSKDRTVRSGTCPTVDWFPRCRATRALSIRSSLLLTVWAC